MYFIVWKALQNVFLRDGVRVGGKYFDGWRQETNRLVGGVSYILTDHAYKLPCISKVYSPDGKEGTMDMMGKDDIICLSHQPWKPLDKERSKLCGSFCGSVEDPWLKKCLCDNVPGSICSLILDRMPKTNCHSFVALVQVDKAYNRRKVEENMFNIVNNYGNFSRGGWGHQHDGFSCFFGKHHAYRSFVGDYRYRKVGDLDGDVSNFVLN